MKRPTQPGIAAAVLGVAVVVSIGPVPVAPGGAVAERPAAPVSRAVRGSAERVAGGEVDRETVARWLAGVCEAERQWRRDTTVNAGGPADRGAGCDVGAMLRDCRAARVDEAGLIGPAPVPVRDFLGDLSPPQC